MHMKARLEAQNDETLLAAIQAGGHDAFAVLVHRYYKRFYAVAYRFMAQQEEAEDIVQHAFLKLWQQPGSWKAGKSAQFTTWFYRVVVNLCLDSKKQKSSLPLEGEENIPDENHIAQDMRLMEQETSQLLEKAIAALPERQQVALNLCFYEELSNQEAAAIMGVSTKALQSLLMRAKAFLKERMNE